MCICLYTQLYTMVYIMMYNVYNIIYHGWGSFGVCGGADSLQLWASDYSGRLPASIGIYCRLSYTAYATYTAYAAYIGI